ncbi:DUF3060 domain-containing protein [Embleya scabrispora]|uniref:DUF3060 domain-containing protein n=1 Tax=Embleya scabrispora TaxID=159449 RepID=UPI0003A0E7FB|nr:DUF3060 domain-containing protein [Embleya scabrispora]MYS83510.1 DUF3060 domain-containing protein [Streptomyces sp. SID5474]
MRIRTVLPAILITATIAVGTTACEAGVEKKSNSSAPSTSATPAVSGGSTGTPAPATASGQPSTSTTSAPKTGKATSPQSVPAAPSTHGGAGPVVVSGTGAQPTTDCTGRDVRIEGTEITVTLTGFCHDLTVTGSDHTIEVAWADKITVAGSNHLLFYGVKADGSKPDIVDNGTSNKIMTR